MRQTAHLIAAMMLASLFCQAHAQPSAQNTIVAEHPWARATPGGAKTGAAYVTLTSNGGSGDRLLSGTTPVAGQVQFHRVSEESGVSHMRELRAVEVASGAKLTFSPGGMHIMLVGLKQPLEEGQTFSLTLSFENAGKVGF